MPIATGTVASVSVTTTFVMSTPVSPSRASSGAVPTTPAATIAAA